MKAISITDTGIKRKTNQDYVFISEEPIGQLNNVFIVADGMGGHNAGDFASEFCVEKVIDTIKKSKLKTPISIFENAIKKANESLIKEAESKPELDGMGTTMVAATIVNDIMYVANIGDSRLYVIDKKEIRQITEDHSLVEAMVKTGEIKRSDARFHPNKNIITRALGANPYVPPDYFEVQLKKGDVVLMCSDGLSNMIDDEEIKEIVNDSGCEFKETSVKLVEKANDYGGKDNITIIMVRF